MKTILIMLAPLFVCSVSLAQQGRTNTLHGDQTTAEACAKHLKEQMEKKP